MVTPRKRSEFERNLYLMAESLSQGTFIPHRDPKYIRGLTSVKKAPNRRINFHTVNETARLRANSQANMPMIRAELEKRQKNNDQQ